MNTCYYRRLMLGVILLWASARAADATSRRLKSTSPSTPTQSPHLTSHPTVLNANHPTTHQVFRLGSDFPSLFPSHSPTKLLSTQARPIQSDFPSLTPSVSPSSNSRASDLPSLVPSIVPSGRKGSDAPSIVPSFFPSNGLVQTIPALLSDIPSVLPSDTPSMFPSDVPSTAPSDPPSPNPKRPHNSKTPKKTNHRPTSRSTNPRPPSSATVGPSFPTAPPSKLMQAAVVSDLPSLTPSISPSKLAKAHILGSDVPSVSPSNDPSDFPSLSPSAMPSKSPIAAPSRSPIGASTRSPTTLPVASSSPTVTETIYSALSSFKFTGVGYTMDSTVTSIFQDTAMVFFEQRVIEPPGFNATVISVNVISQSVVGGSPARRHRRSLQNNFLVVTFRIVANVVPGDAPNFNFQQVVDTTFNTYSYDFQYRLQAASPFFAGNSQYSVINSLTSSRTSSASKAMSTSSSWLTTLVLSSIVLVITLRLA